MSGRIAGRPQPPFYKCESVSITYTHSSLPLPDRPTASHTPLAAAIFAARLALPASATEAPLDAAAELDRMMVVGSHGGFLGVACVDDMRTVAGQGPVREARSTDAAWVWDLSATWRLAQGLELYARVENLTDREYIVSRRPSGARPGLPRTALAGFRYTF